MAGFEIILDWNQIVMKSSWCQESSWCHLCQHWQHRRLSLRQLTVSPVTTKLALRRLLVFGDVVRVKCSLWKTYNCAIFKRILVTDTWAFSAKLSPAGYHSDVMISVMASQITGVSIVGSTVCSGEDKENIKAPRHWPLRGESTGDRWIPLTKGQ